MKNKLIVSIMLLIFISFSAVAKESNLIVLKTTGNVISAQEQLLANALGYLNQFWSDQEKSFSREIAEKYFDPDTLLIINGKTVYRGYAQLISHFETVKKNIRGQIKFPFLEIIGVDDRLIVRFDENISDNHGGQYPSNVIAIFTLRNGKIWKWDAVVNSAYFSQPDAQKVVYSK
ncbi:MAG: nuclear transport factor 2 family protein [Proteobacteria bacterium]|nr:nuclear transport factor 2 family protein [Pseudomonadota bacterium]